MRKILIIEDEPEMRRNLSTLLRYKDYLPLEAGNGRSGLEVARRERPDLILCDVMMPHMDGREVCRQVRANPALRTIPFVFVTAGSRALVSDGCDYDDYISKPFDLDHLIATVARLIGTA